MKIIQVIHSFPPESMAGSEVYTYNLAKELSKNHQVWIFYRIADPSREEYDIVPSEYEGLPVRKINNLFRYSTSFAHTYRNDEIAKKFGEFLDQVKPDVVHFEHVTCLSTTCIREAHLRSIPVVYTLHDYWLICPRGQFVKRNFEISGEQNDIDCVQCMAYQLQIDGGHDRINKISGRIRPYFIDSSLFDRAISVYQKLHSRLFFSGQHRAIKQIQERTAHVKEMCALVDQFIAPSKFLKQKYVDFGISSEKIFHSDYGFEGAYFVDRRKQSSEKIRFGYIGTLIPTKGVHVLIKAFNRITNPSAVLKIWGKSLPYDGLENYGDYLKSLVKNPNITFLGEYENHDIGEVLSQVDVLVVPSIWFENSPLTIHEAFLAKIPVITSNLGGMAELVRDGENGRLFEMGKEKDLARVMESLIDDPNSIQALSRNMLPVKTIQDDAQEILKFYQKLVEVSRSRN